MFIWWLNPSGIDEGQYQTYARNKLIAEAFYLNGDIEKYGSGFLRIRWKININLFPMQNLNSVEDLINTLSDTHLFFQNQALRQVNVFLTMRNWLFGYYIVEYEQKGRDRAKYGKKLIDTISLKLKEKKIKGFSSVALRTNRLFYLSYPQIRQTLSVEFGDSYLHLNESVNLSSPFENTQIDPYTLVNRFSFSHFIEFLKIDKNDKRTFYETQVLKNNWSVRDLQRAINSMLYERTGLSTNKDAVLRKPIKEERLKSDEVFRSPYILEFLGLKDNSEYSETDLEQAIIDQQT